MLSSKPQEAATAHGHSSGFGHISQPPGTMEYIASSHDNLRSIAVAFDTTTTKLMKLNKMSSLTIFPGQTLYVPCYPDEDLLVLPRSRLEDMKNAPVKSDNWKTHFTGDFSFLSPLSPPASVLPEERLFRDLVMVSERSDGTQPTVNSTDNQVTLKASEEQPGKVDHELDHRVLKTSERAMSVGSSESASFDESFVKIDVHYLIPGTHDMVKGLMLVTTTAFVFTPDMVDPIAKRDGCDDEYGVMCNVERIVGVAMFNDTTRMVASPLSLAKSISSNAGGCSSLSSDTTTEAEAEICEDCSCEDSVVGTMAQETVLDGSGRALTNEVEDLNADEIVQDRKSDVFKLEKEFPFLRAIVKTVGEFFPTFDNLKQAECKAKPLCDDCNYMYLRVRVRQRMGKEFSMAGDNNDEKRMLKTESETRRDENRQLEYWFQVPRKRSDDIYSFFLQWSPEHQKDTAFQLGFVVMAEEPFPDEISSDDEDKKKTQSCTNSSLEFVDDPFDDSYSFEKEWEIISIQEARKKSVAVDALKLAEEDDSLIPDLEKPSSLLTDDTLLSLCKHLPNSCVGYSWSPVYTTNDNGTSLRTLYRSMVGLEVPVLLLVQDLKDNIFGALCSNPLRVSDHYYGTGESFLFTLSPNFEVFKWSGENSFFIKGDTDSLTIGGGKGSFGLWLDADLYRGCSHSCDTFRNKALSPEEDFTIHSIEVWKIKD